MALVIAFTATIASGYVVNKVFGRLRSMQSRLTGDKFNMSPEHGKIPQNLSLSETMTSPFASLMHMTGRITSLTVPLAGACVPSVLSRIAEADSPEKGFNLPLTPARLECPVTHSRCWHKPSNWIDGSSQSNWCRHQASNGVPASVSDQGVETFIMARIALHAMALLAIGGC